MRRTNQKKGIPKWMIFVVIIAVLALAAVVYATSAVQPEQEEVEGTSTSSSSATEETPEPVVLNEHQIQMQAAYTGAENEMIEILQSGVWTADNAGVAVEFGDMTYVVRKNSGTEEEHPYAIASVESTSTPADDDVLYIRTCSMETDTGTYVVTVQESQMMPGAMTLTSKAFNPSALVLTPKSEDFSIDGMNKQVIDALGGDMDAIKDALSEQCSKTYPSANVATCTGVLIQDFNAEEAETTFILNNSSKTKLTLLYSTANETFAIS